MARRERGNKDKKKRRRDRNRPCHEIARLQAESVELERELQEQMTKCSKKARSNFQTYSTNVKLKEMLRQHLDDLSALEQNVARQVDVLVQALPHLLIGTSRNLPFDMEKDYLTFRTMAKSVDQQYVDMDRVLRGAGLDEGKSEVADVYVGQSDGVNGCSETLKSRTRILTPFKSRVMVDTLWRYFQTCQRITLKDNRPKDLKLPLGISTRIAVLKFEIALGDYVCIMRMIVKQFIEKDRTAHVWKVITDWPGVGSARNVKTHERGWGFIQPIENGTSSSCLSYSFVNPTVEEDHSSESCEAIKSLIRVYQRFVIWRLQSLENQALDQTIQDEKTAAT